MTATGQHAPIVVVAEELVGNALHVLKIFRIGADAAEYAENGLHEQRRLDQAASEKMRKQNPDGVIDPGICEGLQDQLPGLPSNVDPEDPRLNVRICESCAERDRQLANVRRKMDSGEYQLPDIVRPFNKEET